MKSWEDVFSAGFYHVTLHLSSTLHLHGISFGCLFREQIDHVKSEAVLTRIAVVKMIPIEPTLEETTSITWPGLAEGAGRTRFKWLSTADSDSEEVLTDL